PSQLHDESEDFPADFPSRRATPHDLFYVIFTSGTTGAPKGVMVENHSFTSLLDWLTQELNVGEASRMSMVGNVGSDVTHLEIWSALTSGATLIIADGDVRRDPVKLLEFFARYRVTHAYSPAVMTPRLLGTEQPPELELKFLISAGDKLPAVSVDGLSYTVVDCYGPRSE